MTDIATRLPSISVITATYNAAELLPRLVDSLKAQTDPDFEWVVADGGSIDQTDEILSSAKMALDSVVITRQADFGIYDALNRAVRLSTGDYYIVLGADDTLEPDAVENYKTAIGGSRAGFVTARVASGGAARGPRARPWVWLYGQFAHVSAHAVGLAIRRNLHNSVGYYSRRFPIAADQLFILQAVKQGAVVKQADFLAGHFDNVSGTSSQDVLGTLTEGFRVQVLTGQSMPLQLVLFVLRVLKNWRSICMRR